MDVITRAVGFVIVAIAAKMEEIEFVDETFFFEEIDGAIDGDEMDFGADLLGALEDLVDVEMLLSGVHDLENDAALACEPNSPLAEGVAEVARGCGGVDAFTAGDPARWSGGHRATLEGVV